MGATKREMKSFTVVYDKSIEDDEEIFIKVEITNRYGNQDILFITFDDLKSEDGKIYLTLDEIVEEQSND